MNISKTGKSSDASFLSNLSFWAGPRDAILGFIHIQLRTMYTYTGCELSEAAVHLTVLKMCIFSPIFCDTQWGKKLSFVPIDDHLELMIATLIYHIGC